MAAFKSIDDVDKRHRFQTKLPIFGDEEGLLLTSYQQSSEHIADRIIAKLGKVAIAELCSGIGGTTMFLAETLPHVYAVDLNPMRLKAAQLNAKTFGVEDKITFIEGDITNDELLSRLREQGVEAAVTDVEWRADLTKSLKETTSDINLTIPSTPLVFTKLVNNLTANIVMHMAKTTNKDQLTGLAQCEIEEVYLSNELKFLNVYFGRLINKVGITRFDMDDNLPASRNMGSTPVQL